MPRRGPAIQKALLLGLALCATVGHTKDDLDWKLCGFTGTSKDNVGVFFLQSEIKRMLSGIVQVWTKALSSTKLQKASDAMRPNDALFKRVVAKVAAYYQPPYGTIRTLKQSEMLDVISYEVIADAGTITPQDRILWEINCVQAIYRTLSVITKKQPGPLPSAWQPVPPESTIRSLVTLTCPAT